MLLLFSVAVCNSFQVSAQPGKPAPAAAHVKKDGTPDKRFKENKAQPAKLTKSGKPDMRYKENKAAATAAKPAAKPQGPVTQSGKPDMRHKANNPDAGKPKAKP